MTFNLGGVAQLCLPCGEIAVDHRCVGSTVKVGERSGTRLRYYRPNVLKHILCIRPRPTRTEKAEKGLSVGQLNGL